MSFSRPFQWYHSHVDPIWPDGAFSNFLNLPPPKKTCYFSAGDSAAGADQPGGGYLVAGRPCLRPPHRFLPLRRRHGPGDPPQHHHCSPRLPRRALRGRLRGRQGLHSSVLG
jgi:hypothetical protein